MKQFFLFAVISALILTSCKKDTVPQTVFNGPVQQFQQGRAWTWIQTDGNDKPVRLAIAIDDAVMNSLDRSTTPHESNEVLLQLPAKAGLTPFNHVELGWNPQGHEPNFIYGLPHFDFHFYTVSPEAVDAIPPYQVDSSKFKNWPAAVYFPPTYFNPGGGVPKMGVHWLDGTSPELHGATFTQTFIYGSYDGKVTFYEPMITEQFILNNPSFQRDIPQPAKVQVSGYYPTRMRIAKANGVTNIILDEFVYRQAS